AHRVRAVEALALGWTQAPLHLKRLPVSGGEVVEDRVAKNVFSAFGGGNVGAGALGDRRDFQLVVHHLAVAGPAHGRAWAGDGLAVGDVVDRDLPVYGGQLAERGGHRRLEGLDAAGLHGLDGPRAPRRLPDV